MSLPVFTQMSSVDEENEDFDGDEPDHAKKSDNSATIEENVGVLGGNKENRHSDNDMSACSPIRANLEFWLQDTVVRKQSSIQRWNRKRCARKVVSCREANINCLSKPQLNTIVDEREICDIDDKIEDLKTSTGQLKTSFPNTRDNAQSKAGWHKNSLIVEAEACDAGADP